MWELDYKESWAVKHWWFWTVVLEKTLESPLDCKEIQPVNPKGNQSWILTGKTNGKFEVPILWPPDAENWCPGNYSDARKDWRQEEKQMTEDEVVGWHHWLNEHEFEQVPGFGDEQGCEESDMTEWLNWTETMFIVYSLYSDYSITVNCIKFIVFTQQHLRRAEE